MQFLCLGEVCVRECRSYASSAGHRVSVETLAMCGSNYPFKYELPHIYSHFISSAGGVPSAVSHFGEGVHLLWCMQSHTTGSGLHLSLPGTTSAGEHPKVSTVMLWLYSSGHGDNFSRLLVLIT